MFQARGEEDEEKDVTEWRLKRYLRMLSNRKRPQFRKPAEMPMSGPSMLFQKLIKNYIKKI